MAHAPDQDDTLPEDTSNVQPEDATDTAIGTPAPDASPDTSSAADAPASPAAIAPQTGSEPATTTAPPSNLAELSAQLREAAAEIAEIAAQAGRLGITIDAAKALREGTTPEALRQLVLERASAAADARDIVAAPPSLVLPLAKESPIVTAAKRAAASGNRA